MRLLATALMVLLLVPAAALADGDPASDVLPFRAYYLPYAPPTSNAAKARIFGATKAATDAGYEIRVAVISGMGDLGAVPQYDGQPQRYADFLASELRFAYSGPLLVVMPGGYGLHGAGAAVGAALKSLPPPASSDPTALVNAAADAVKALADASGHPITIPALPTEPASAPTPGGGSNSSVIVLVAGGSLAVLALLGGLFWWIRRAPVDDG